MPIQAVSDHVAVAVPSIEDAAGRWHDALGGGWVTPRFAAERAGFATRQLRYPGGAKLELLEPTDEDGFAARFLERFGARIHHVTLKVPALLPAVETLEQDGFDVVDVFAEGDVWHEAFLRPTQVGGLIVQVAWAGRTEEDWARLTGTSPESPRPDAATLLGPTLQHPRPSEAAQVWKCLGAEVVGSDDGIVARWPDAPLDVVVEPGAAAGPVGLRFTDASPIAADDTHGPPVISS
ncbi:VOC family protein [Egicoccus sp. AB-alg2]|uniref:VOC family protein n=1 Tax=Egicoccus sp. AB-alg2 TaxID=3242693 RepID=UPI00359E34D0